MSAGNRSAGPGKRALVALAMGAIVAPFTLTGIASADVRPITANACPEDQVTGPDVEFDDIEGLSAEAQLAINCIADYGVTQGVDENSFEPGNAVNRAQMALFLARLLSLSPDLEPLEDAGGNFTDIGNLSEDAQDAINILANLEITLGVAPGQYGPSQPITRAQMASFIARTQAVLGVPLEEATQDFFADDNGSVHEDAINAIAQAGIAQGVAANQFAPLRPTTREQMAKFLARHLDLAVEEGLIELPEEYQDDPTDPEAPAIELTTGDEDVVAGADITAVITNVDLEGVTAEDITATIGEGADAVELDVQLGEDGELTLTLPEDIEAGEQTVAISVVVEGEDEPIELELTFEVVVPDTEANETLVFGPDDAVSVELQAAGTTDRRSFLATGLNNELEYRVTLVQASLVAVDENGRVTFTNDTTAGEEGFAEVGTANDIANIAAISNVGSDAVGDNSATARPVNGAITVTIEGETAGSVIPVIYVNGGAAGNTPAQGGTSTRLELDASGVPTEPFGVAGVTTFTVPQAAVGDDAVDFGVDAVNRGTDTFTGDPDGANSTDDADEVSFTYDANDTFTITVGGTTSQATLEDFEAALSVGDEVDVEDYQRNAALRSTFNLDNIDPQAPGVSVVDTNDTNVVLTVTGVGAGNTVRVFGQVDATPTDATNDPALTTSATVLATATADQVPDVAGDVTTTGFNIVVSGLTASTGYDLAVSQVEAGEESPLSATENVTTSPTQVSPVISTSVRTTDAVLEGAVGDGDVLTFTFNRDIELDAGSVTLSFTDASGNTFVLGNATAVTADTNVTAATFTPSDGTDTGAGTEVLTVEVDEDAIDRNAAGGEDVLYPITLTGVSGVADDVSGGDVTLTGSDVSIP